MANKDQTALLSVIPPEPGEASSLSSIALDVGTESLIPLAVNSDTVETFAAGKATPVVWVEIDDHDVFIHGAQVLLDTGQARPTNPLAGVLVHTPEAPTWPAIVDDISISESRMALTGAYQRFINRHEDREAIDSPDFNTPDIGVENAEEPSTYQGGIGLRPVQTAIHYIGTPTLADPVPRRRRPELPIPAVLRRRLR